MDLLNFIKRYLKNGSSPEKPLRRLLGNIPEYYKTHRQFEYCIEHLEYHEWEFAIDSLIEFANDTEHTLPDDFWLGLVESSDIVGLTEQADYCRRQISRNR